MLKWHEIWILPTDLEIKFSLESSKAFQKCVLYEVTFILVLKAQNSIYIT